MEIIRIRAHAFVPLIGVWIATLFVHACVPAQRSQTRPVSSGHRSSWGGPRIDSRASFKQSCGTACAVPINPSTGELLAPSVSRTGQVVQKVRDAAEAVQGFSLLDRALTGAELDQVEQVLRDCVAQAHADVNDAYQRQEGGRPFKNGKFPNDSECRQVVGTDEAGEDITLARMLGNLKHIAAFACVSARLPSSVREHFTVEPRYKPDPKSNGFILTKRGHDTLRPDFVVHGTRNATDVQCVYEFKFPCLSKNKLDPRTIFGAEAQLTAYQKLSYRCPVAIVSPQGLFELRP
ncbi:hypothetical protein [Melittangium boletus]|uniref:Uncharacterized protein n=1 Tax=Melittangium boletus DSM 14713 TaxID=1294270 RepID=A0A250ILG7_9BACT|nr:hypothetical protein [Melittangium boletus]ATB32584.1 hypothetical protein MEBOL_006072 [Melittangium boletus DSM 14713]